MQHGSGWGYSDLCRGGFCGCRMGLPPAPAFHFPVPGGDGQSLQRHRSTSTPNVHMVSTVGVAGASFIEVWTFRHFTNTVGQLLQAGVTLPFVSLSGSNEIQQRNRWVFVDSCMPAAIGYFSIEHYIDYCNRVRAVLHALLLFSYISLTLLKSIRNVLVPLNRLEKNQT